MADPTEQRVKEERRAEALRANLKRRKTQVRGRDDEQVGEVPLPRDDDAKTATEQR